MKLRRRYEVQSSSFGNEPERFGRYFRRNGAIHTIAMMRSLRTYGAAYADPATIAGQVSLDGARTFYADLIDRETGETIRFRLRGAEIVS